MPLPAWLRTGVTALEAKVAQDGRVLAGRGLEPKRDDYGVLVSFDPCNDRRNSANRLPPVTIPSK